MKGQKEKLKQKRLKGASGITLIALVITIIVLLILAAVSIATLTGDNGILTKAQTAQVLTKQENAKEKVQVEVLGSLDNSGDIDLSVLNKNLEHVEGITQGTPIESLPAELTVDGCKVKIDSNGKVTVEGEVAENPTDPPKTPTLKNVNTAETNPAGSMPTGATVVEENGKELNDANEGIVIKDTNDNEWVWIEVPKLQSKMPADIEFTNETGYSEDDQEKCDSITAALKAYADPYTKGSASQTESWADEWYADRGTNDIVTENTAKSEEQGLNTGCGLTLSEYKETYQKMIKSVYKNGGFWLGRYEAGIEGTTETDLSNARTTHTDITDGSPKAISQKDAIPYNYVYCSEAQKLASKMTPDSNKTSSLLFGIQWDLVCKYLEVKSNELNVSDINSNSEKWGNYKNVTLLITSPNAKGYTYNDKTWSKISENKLSYDDNKDYTLLSTGASDNTKKSNIYDFAGNESEWTLDHATAGTNGPCISRGGYFFYDSSYFPASYRYDGYTTSANDRYSFRPALY